MCSDMIHQALRPRISPVTLGAGELLPPNVSLYMSTEMSSLGKGLFTLRAVIGMISFVDSTVCLQGTRLGEGLVTGGAGE